MQHTLVRRAHTSSCSSGTQAHSEGSGREAAAAVHRDPAHATQAAANTAGEKRDFYLFSPSSPGTNKPWPFVLRGSGSEGLSGAHGPRLRTRLRVALLGRQHRIPLGCAASGPGARSTARPWLPANGASPRPGCFLKGCLPRPGGFAGAGHSFSSSDSGCSCNLPACSGGK